MDHAATQLGRNAAAIAATTGISPGNHGTIALQGGKGKLSGENLSDATAELAGYPTTITTPS